MKKNIFQTVPTRCICLLYAFFCLFFTACGTPKPIGSEQNSLLPRADSRYIGWLEKESAYNACAEKIKIVTGTNFAWNFSSSAHAKDNILKISPLWLHINPCKLAKDSRQSPLQQIKNNAALLKNAGINALYLYPNKSLSFENLHGLPESNAAQTNSAKFSESPVSLSMAKQTGTAEDIFALMKNNVQTAGNLLPASLGTGADFLLALHGVREYPGLFMMSEVPQNLWHILPPSQDKEHFEPAVLSKEQMRQLSQSGIVPPAFYRDFFTDFPPSGFAVSNETKGYDGVTRRWLYRFAKTPHTAVLNFYDPSFQTQRLLSASIIEEIGILRQGLVSVSVQDVWGQESMQEQDGQNISPKTFCNPARFVLESINRAVHGYGAWTFCRDPFPPYLIKSIQEAQTDFAADTLIMPALEQALIKEDSTPLIDAFSELSKEQISEQSLWHGTHASFFQSPYRFPSLTRFIMHKTDISEQEISQLKKMQESPLFTAANPKLSQKLSQAKNLHKLFIGFQSLLPGLNMVCLEDLLGVSNEELDFSAFINKETQNPMLFGNLAAQVNQKNSALEALRPIWEFRQKNELHLAKIHRVYQTGNPKIFAFCLAAPKNRFADIAVNLSAVPQTFVLKGQKRHLQAFGIFWRQ